MGSGGRPSAALSRAACCWVLVDMPTVQMCGWHTAAAAGMGSGRLGAASQIGGGRNRVYRAGDIGVSGTQKDGGTELQA